MKGQEGDFVIEINSSTDISKSRMKGKTKLQRMKAEEKERLKALTLATKLITNKHLKCQCPASYICD